MYIYDTMYMQCFSQKEKKGGGRDLISFCSSGTVKQVINVILYNLSIHAEIPKE